MAAHVTRAYTARVEDINTRDRSLVAKINTCAVDRYRSVIDARGIDLAAYRANPVVLWEHGRDVARGAMPIGRNEWIRPAIGPDGPELLAKTSFYSKGKKGDDFTERLWECYRDGDMRAFSVNVVPDERTMSPPTADEKHDRPALEDCLMMYRKSDLAEYSLVSVPGNAEALTMDEARNVRKLVARGLALPADLVARAEDMADDEDDAEERRIVEEGGKWVCYSKSGKKLGEFDSAEEAESCKKGAPKDKGGKGGKDDADEDDERKKKMRSLPALGGRSFSDHQAEVARQVRAMFDVGKITDDLRAQADLKRGIV
jgi:hypothetical protein